MSNIDWTEAPDGTTHNMEKELAALKKIAEELK